MWPGEGHLGRHILECEKEGKEECQVHEEDDLDIGRKGVQKEK